MPYVTVLYVPPYRYFVTQYMPPLPAQGNVCACTPGYTEVYRINTFGCISPLRYFAHIAKEITA